MNMLKKSRNLLSVSAVAVVLTATMGTSEAIAESNDTWKTIHNGWLAEYALQPDEVMARTDRVYRAVSAENDTFATAGNGWLHQYRLRPGEVVPNTGRIYSAVSADNDTYATIHNGWLSEYEAGGDPRMLAGTDEQGRIK